MPDYTKHFSQNNRGRNFNSQFNHNQGHRKFQDDPLLSKESPIEIKNIQYRDDQNHLRKELLLEESENWAVKIAAQKVSYTQLRKFYSEALALKAKLEKKEEGFKEMEALIGMMISKAHYSMVRDKKNKTLFQFIKSCITSIHSEQDYSDFVMFFEAVLGFYPRKD